MKHLLAILVVLLATAAQATEKVASFGILMLGNSLQTLHLGQDPAEVERVNMIKQIVVDRFVKESFGFVDLEPEHAAIDRQVNLAKCYGCDIRIEDRLGADYSLVGERSESVKPDLYDEPAVAGIRDRRSCEGRGGRHLREFG